MNFSNQLINLDPFFNGHFDYSQYMVRFYPRDRPFFELLLRWNIEGIKKKRVSKKVVELNLVDDLDYTYYKIVEAHRSYMFAMSKYKHMRYGIITNQQRDWTWFGIDQHFIKAISLYDQ